MAKKPTKKSRSFESKLGRFAKGVAKASVKKAAAKGRAAAKPKTAARAKPRAAASRAKAAAASRRAHKPRQQPETLRCKALTVALTADDVEKSLRFWVDGVGFHVKQRWEKDGKLLGAELVAGACMIGVSQDDWAKGRNRTKGVGLSVYAESTQGVDALAERLRARGVDFAGPDTTEWGWRQVSLTDPDGFRFIVYEEKKR
ncbi:MAG TPA: VOC family protein [Thermoanaerobaculia bacterium]|nr:VOC family protein [Thermoanaerobaculia bacterium]